ncbi:MAG: DNA mismatch endonuclease Vsr [Rhodospirillales bacterium]|nr:DNA mismatch endonuclease Vsr [Rhodospirillales bacterium]
MTETTSEIRSRTMRAIRSTNTKPEMIVRKLVHSMGYRYRLHRKDLPGHPDLTFPALRKIIFVNGCFWHGHDCKRGARIPKTNRGYWLEKIARNKERDSNHNSNLAVLGWQVLTIWECEICDSDTLQSKIRSFLNSQEKRKPTSEML